MKFLKFFDSIIEFVETWFIILCVILMIFFSFIQVFLRNLFSSGIPGTDELLRHMVFWTGLAGASLLTKEGRHIKIDVLARALPERLENIRFLTTNLVSAIISGVLFKTSLEFLLVEREFAESATLFLFHVPIWILQIAIPLTFLMMTIRYTFKIIDKFMEIIK